MIPNQFLRSEKAQIEKQSMNQNVFLLLLLKSPNLSQPGSESCAALQDKKKRQALA